MYFNLMNHKFYEENNCLTCHIVGLNPISKKEMIEFLNKKIFNPIDLDEINSAIITDEQMNTLFKQYEKLKEKKNDTFKEIDKKMTMFWENKFLELLSDKVKIDKKNILIGQTNHYRVLNKKINLNTPNKFYIKEKQDDIKKYIEYNLNTHHDDIINGKFPIEHLDFEYLSKKTETIAQTYIKNGYLEKNYDQVKTILNLLETKIIDIPGLWISMTDSYNLGSKIHPKKNGKILAYVDGNMALLGSFKFNKDELKKNFNGQEVKIKELKPQSLDKLKTKRFLYLVEKNSFIPHEKGANQKFFSQSPVVILQKEKINDVYSYLIDK
jgi:hypothetical protein